MTQYLLKCIDCKGHKITAGDKKEMSAANGWRRKLTCNSCKLTWMQVFYRGVFEVVGGS